MKSIAWYEYALFFVAGIAVCIVLTASIVTLQDHHSHQSCCAGKCQCGRACKCNPVWRDEKAAQ